MLLHKVTKSFVFTRINSVNSKLKSHIIFIIISRGQLREQRSFLREEAPQGGEEAQEIFPIDNGDPHPEGARPGHREDGHQHHPEQIGRRRLEFGRGKPEHERGGGADEGRAADREIIGRLHQGEQRQWGRAGSNIVNVEYVLFLLKFNLA